MDNLLGDMDELLDDVGNLLDDLGFFWGIFYDIRDIFANFGGYSIFAVFWVSETKEGEICKTQQYLEVIISSINI